VSPSPALKVPTADIENVGPSSGIVPVVTGHIPLDPQVPLRRRGGHFRPPWHASQQVLAGSQRHSTPTRGVYMTDWIQPLITASRRRTLSSSQPLSASTRLTARSRSRHNPGFWHPTPFRQAQLNISFRPETRPVTPAPSGHGRASGTDLLFRPPQSSPYRSSIGDHQPIHRRHALA
jgi:hypothetical protein